MGETDSNQPGDRLKYMLIAGSLACVLFASVNGAAASADSKLSSVPTWSQHYTTQPDSGLNRKVWNAETGNNNGWGNNEAEFYSTRAENLRVSSGNLVLSAKPERYHGYHYSSARINTRGKLDFLYGRLSIVAKLPKGVGVWPAIWLWPSSNKYSHMALNPQEQSQSWLVNGEIDIIEGSAQGDSTISGSAHSLTHYPGHLERTGTANVANLSTAYHTYELQKTPDALIYSIDDKPFYAVRNPHTSFKDWPYNQRYHLIMNVAVGGSMSQNLKSLYLPYGVDNRGAPWQMKVKSIDFYPLITAP
jgi:beta-glucanase (GH16 family)